ncbi:MAG: DUF3365 domain-containing protein [Gammaproteobacteria bacterium]|nr:DUF3365 domain-containing protein [Gammaproteobacteria bacterium]MBU1654170.1 DUF3365 domain-containing protein [Gammaproteobacteria bacterium]
MKQSIATKYSFIFFVTLVLIVAAVLLGIRNLKTNVLRNEARAVATQVVAFRAWVAKAGQVFWKGDLPEGFHDYLAKKEFTDSLGVTTTFHGKNPALATRELSNIVNKSSLRATFRVTSDQYRNDANAPDYFETDAIQQVKANRGLKFVEGYDQGNYRYIEPILVQEACLKCHGDPKDAPPEVVDKYGDKKAFGYKVGDVRGVISVKLPDLTLADVLPTLANPYSISLLVIAILINLIFTRYGLIKRLRDLTEGAEAIAEGNLDRELKYTKPDHSKDEIDHVFHAVSLLRNSMNIAMQRIMKGRKGDDL